MTIVTTHREPVPGSLPTRQSPRTGSWQQAMKQAVRDPAQLCRLLELPEPTATKAQAAAADFPLFVPQSYLARMRKGDLTDPLLRQVLPLSCENIPQSGDQDDPVGDAAASLQPGLLHKYQGRVLLVTTGACAVHCRYCFRRHYPYSQSPRSPQAWEPALRTIAQDTSLREVILSGGDPLTLIDEHLADLTTRLGRIEHLKRLRLHTRLPIMIPQRVTDALLDWLTATRLTPIMVVHVNHAAELDTSTAAALERLRGAGIVVINQAVLLRGVNDSVEALVDLSTRLVDLGVMPYYLHQLDRVTGAAHFEVPRETGQQLIEQMRAQLPGYAVPRYVQEIAGAAHKVVLA